MKCRSGGLKVDVDVDVRLGFPQFTGADFPEGAVRESIDRVRSALKNTGYELSRRKVSVAVINGSTT